MKLSKEELNEIKALNIKIQNLYAEFMPMPKEEFTDDGLMTVWYFPKMIVHIETLEQEIEQLLSCSEQC